MIAAGDGERAQRLRSIVPRTTRSNAFVRFSRVLVVAALLVFDAHGLGRLMLHDRSPVLAFGLLLFGFVITLGSWVMGTAIMQIGRDR
jgi:hypothetical protein